MTLVGVVPNLVFSADHYVENLSKDGNGNYLVGPGYRIDPDLTDQNNPKGKYFEFSMRLADSNIFRGDDPTLDSRKNVRKERKIFVYVPAAYQDGTEAPILVMQDGPSRLNLVRNALDNLTISKDSNRQLPAFIVIAVQSGGDDSKGSERGLEYDTMPGPPWRCRKIRRSYRKRLGLVPYVNPVEPKVCCPIEAWVSSVGSGLRLLTKQGRRINPNFASLAIFIGKEIADLHPFSVFWASGIERA
jgi:hypothetical protein